MKVLIFDLTYLIAIVFLGMCIYNGENILTHIYWTRLVVFIFVGICAVLGIGSFINEVIAKKMKPVFVSYIRAIVGMVYIILLVVSDIGKSLFYSYSCSNKIAC